MEKTYLVKRYDMAAWYEKVALYFLAYQTHESEEGFVIYKTLLGRFYVYVHGHYVQKHASIDPGYTPPPVDPGFDGGVNTPWNN